MHEKLVCHRLVPTNSSSLLLLVIIMVCPLPLPCTQFGRTEQIKNNHDPVFSKTMELQYRFEEAQKLKFLVYDVDNETDSLRDDDFLGMMVCTLGEVCPSLIHYT